ncbi:MAG: hypothetical protein ABEK03_02060 [Candidatus Bipolaricaulia bacterium]
MSREIWILIGIISLLAVGLLTGLVPIPTDSEPSAMTEHTFAIPESLNGWKRLDERTLAFQGPIRQGSFSQMEAMFDGAVDTLVITSQGGRVAPGVRIGELVLQEKLDVIVERYCLSSCANYIFLASQPKVIRQGIVGFHGNITHSIRQAGGPEARAEQMASQTPRSQEELASLLRERIEMEQSLIRRIGVPQDFYAMTASTLKERNQGTDASYDFLLPSMATFAEYGITDIQGQQSKTWQRKAEQQLGVQMLRD